MATKLTYLTIPHDPGPKPAGIPPLREFLPARSRMKLKAGERMGEDYLAGIWFQMIKKAGNELTDFLYSVDRLLVASERVRGFLQEQGFGDGETEYLPIKLKDKKGKPRHEKYFVVNPLLKVPCLDTKKSDCELFTNPISGQKTWRLETLVIQEKLVPKDARLFRLAEAPERILVRSDLLAAMEEAGFTGLAPHEQGEAL